MGFLREKSNASFSKVRCAKFAIKADVFEDVAGMLVHFVVKMRVYRTLCRYSDNGTRLAVDFQRRTGDAVAFRQFFRRAHAHLNMHFKGDSLEDATTKVDEL